MKYITCTISLFFTLLLFNTAVRAQDSYFVNFSNPYEEKCFSIIEDSNQDLLGVGLSCSDITQLQTMRGVIWKISGASDTISKYFSFNDTSCYFNYVEERNDGYHVIGTFFSPPDYNTSQLVHLHLDINLNLISKTIIIDNNSLLWIDNRIRLLNSQYYLLGDEELGPLDYDCIVKLDLDFQLVNFHILWERDIKLMDCLLSPDSSEFWLFTSGYNYLAGDELLRFNSAMELIEVKNFPFKYFPGTIDAEVQYGKNLTCQWFSESKFLIGCNHKQSFNGVIEESIGYSLLDSTLNLVPIQYIGSQDTTDYAAFFTNFYFEDTNQVFICGAKNVISWFFPDEPSWIIAGKLDHNLEPVYTRYYGGDAYYWVYSIIATSDGGSVISSARYDHLTQYNERDVSFLRLDANGLITGNSPNTIGYQPFLVFPNPVTHDLNFDTSIKQGTLNIYSIEGSLLKTHFFSQRNFEINVSNLTPGIYICEIIDDKGQKSFNKFIKN